MIVIPVGVTARNEARNMLLVLASLNAAVARASAELACTFQVHVLLNDNYDESPVLLANIPSVTVWHTTGGIVEAQRTLADAYGAEAPFLVFCDADILVSENALLEVARAMFEDPRLEIAYAGKYPLPPVRRTPLATALYLYNLREGYQTTRHYCNGQLFAIRCWRVPRAEELRWDARADSPFLNLAHGIRVDDIYLSREIMRRAGPTAIRCVEAGIRYRTPETLRGMFRKYQRMRLELERLDAYFPEWRAAHVRWGQRARDPERLAAAPFWERRYYDLFRLALLLCKAAYFVQRVYYTHVARRPCPTWLPVEETKVALS